MQTSKFFVFNRPVFAVALLFLSLCAVSNAATERVLATFKDGPGGKYPLSSLIFDKEGNLYGSASEGGTGTCNGIDGAESNCGVVFRLTPTKTGWTKTVLYRFKGGADGNAPIDGLVFDTAGNLYGITNSSFDVPTPDNCGEVFELSPSESGLWKKTTLHTFTGGKDGCLPISTPVFDKSGNLYGVTEFGGIKSCQVFGISPPGCGTLYQLAPKQDGNWSERILYRFRLQQDGGDPYGDLAFDDSGRLWGTAFFGGNTIVCEAGCGVVFYFTPSKTGRWTETIVHSFTGGYTDGQSPTSGVTLGRAGSVFVTTNGGGNQDGGAVFEFVPKKSGGFSQKMIVSEESGGAGISRVILDPAGNLFGTIAFAGAGNACNQLDTGCGLVFQLSPGANGNWTQTFLYQFNGQKDGLWPLGDALVRDAAGTLYGTTLFGGHVGPKDEGDGVVFEILP